MQFAATVDPLRYSPAIHVNQEGYMPNYSKKAMVGYYVGSLGEMQHPDLRRLQARRCRTAARRSYQGTLVQRDGFGLHATPPPLTRRSMKPISPASPRPANIAWSSPAWAPRCRS